MSQELIGRRVLVTGAATGIGAAAVEVLVAAGATVTATYHRTPPPDALARSATWLRYDLRAQGDAVGAVDEAATAMNGLDALVHAAGSWGAGLAGELTEEDLEYMLATNVKATVFANQAAFHVMKGQAGGGRIVNFGSSEGASGSLSRPPTPCPKGRSTAGPDQRRRPGASTRSRSTRSRPPSRPPAPTASVTSSDPPAPPRWPTR